MSDRRRDDDVLDLLDELGDTLDDLRGELRAERDRSADSDRLRPPRPPTFSEVMRFTESYTIPTVIAVLEATIASLELLRRLLRLADPGRAVEDARSETEARMREVPRTAVTGVERALDELRTALSEADLPSNPEARDVLERARSLADELDARLADAERDRETRERRWRDDETRFESRWRRRDDRGAGRRRGDRSEPIRIDVTDEGQSSDNPSDRGDADADADDAQVDVDAELESIKREVRGDEEDDDDGEGGDDERSDY